MAISAVGLAVGIGPPDAAAEEEAFIPGSGAVDTRIVRVGPIAGRLAFAPTVGMALANYTGTVGRAESRYVDYAALDDEIPPELKEQAPALLIDSSEEGAEEGRSATTLGLPAGSPVQAGGSTQRVVAGDEPFGESSFTLGDFSPVPGVVVMSGATATSRAGVIEGAVREAVGTVDIGRLQVGPVVLEGLRWDLAQRTGGKEEAGGRFGIRGITIAGQRVEPPPPDQLGEVFEQVNGALEPLGLRVELPRAGSERGVATITPLVVRITASEVGRALGPPLLGGLQPVREPLTQGLIEGAPQAAGLVTLADVTLGALAGSGSLSLEFGGGTAFTEGEAFDDPFGEFDLSSGGGFDLGPVSLGSGGSSSLGSAVTGGDAPEPGGGEDGGAAQAAELAGNRRIPGSTGGPAAVVGLIGLLAVLAVAGADWHRMHHAPRRIQV